MQGDEPKGKKEKAVEEVTTLGKKIAEGEEYFAVAHIFASFNDTFVVSGIDLFYNHVFHMFFCFILYCIVFVHQLLIQLFRPISYEI